MVLILDSTAIPHGKGKAKGYVNAKLLSNYIALGRTDPAAGGDATLPSVLAPELA